MSFDASVFSAMETVYDIAYIHALTHMQAHTQQAFVKEVVEPAPMLPRTCLLPSIRSTCEQMRAKVSVRAYVSA